MHATCVTGAEPKLTTKVEAEKQKILESAERMIPSDRSSAVDVGELTKECVKKLR